MALTAGAQLLDNAYMTGVNISLPTIQKEFNVSSRSVQRLISAYTLTLRRLCSLPTSYLTNTDGRTCSALACCGFLFGRWQTAHCTATLLIHVTSGHQLLEICLSDIRDWCGWRDNHLLYREYLHTLFFASECQELVWRNGTAFQIGSGVGPVLSSAVVEAVAVKRGHRDLKQYETGL
jgi:hypothetical protein